MIRAYWGTVLASRIFQSVLSAWSKLKQVLSQMTPSPFWSNVLYEVKDCDSLFHNYLWNRLWATIKLLDMLHCDLGWKSSLSSVSWVRFPSLLERLFLVCSLLWVSSPIWNNFELLTVLKTNSKEIAQDQVKTPLLILPIFLCVINCELRLNMTDKLFLWNPYD